MAQEKLDAFMQEKVHDFSKLAEQDMANASLLKELIEVYSEVTMAKDALKQKAAEIAVAAEDNGVGTGQGASRATSRNGSANTPDRTKWTQEDPLGKTDIPMPELAQGTGGHGRQADGAAGGPVRGDGGRQRQLGRLGRQGHRLGRRRRPDRRHDRQGRHRQPAPQQQRDERPQPAKAAAARARANWSKTPPRAKAAATRRPASIPRRSRKGQIKDDSKDPVGGATGGGKMSGQGGQGLEGPVPPSKSRRCSASPRSRRSSATTPSGSNLQYQLGRYDNFKLTKRSP